MIKMEDYAIVVYKFDEDFDGYDDEAIKAGAYHYVDTLYGQEAIDVEQNGLPEGMFTL